MTGPSWLKGFNRVLNHSDHRLRTHEQHPDTQCLRSRMRAAKVLPRPLTHIKEIEEDKAAKCRRDFMRPVQELPYPAFLRDGVAEDGHIALESWRQSERLVEHGAMARHDGEG